MKKLKKLFGVLFAFVMVMGLTVTASADDTTYTITINNDTDGYVYTAYQIFEGDLSDVYTEYNGTEAPADGTQLYTYDDTTDTYTTAEYDAAAAAAGTDYYVYSEVLTNISWGSGVTSTDAYFLSALTTVYSTTDAAEVAAELTTESEAKAFAAIVGGYLTTGTDSEDAGDTYTISGLAAGYYLVVNTTVPTTSGAYTSYILQVVESVTVSPKSAVPSSDKTVDDINDSTETDMTTGEDADHDIGDDVPFALTATLPTNYGSYNTYKLIFHDVMEDGLTFNSESVVVTVYASTSDTTGTVAKAGYSVVTDCYHLVSISVFDGTTTYYTYDGSSYSAVQSGATYDEDTSYYVKADCTFEVVIADTNSLEDSSGSKISVTADSIITVSYTATLNEEAVIGNPGNHNTMYIEYSNNPNWDGTGTEPTGETPEDTVVVFTYKLVANKVDSSGNTLSGAGFTLYKMDADSGNYVVVEYYKETTIADSNEYAAGVSSGITYYTYDTDDNVYKASTVYVDGETYYIVCTEMNGGTSFTWKGLDDGMYKLVETTTPTGYNTMDDLYFTVEATHTEDGITSLVIKDADGNEISGTGQTFNTTYSTGSISTDITNYTGSELPSTGGIGTTIFYAIGATLMVIAFVLLITKRRMRKYE